MAELVNIKVEGSVHSVERGTPLSDLVRRISPSHEPLLILLDGQTVGREFELERDAEVRLLFADSADALVILRHSASHLMAQAVLDLYPGTQIGIGPSVENGFYYDFLRDEPFTTDDLNRIEARMKELQAADIPIERIILSKEEAVQLFQSRGQELKVELIREKADEKVICYRQRDFIDFCRGPHLLSTGQIKHFKLLSVSGAYWKGDERGRQLQRVYGTAFFSRKALDDYLKILEEAKRRDHRKLGQTLDLFSTAEDLGAGLVLWHPMGSRIRAVIEDHWRKRHREGGYEVLYTPHIGRESLWQTSGHLGFYKESMYSPMQIDEQNYYLKPMNCPFHIMIYKSRLRSYRELPLRWAELGTVYRYERSGVLHGLMRVRGFTQDDAHIFCTPQQIEGEILRVLDFSISLLADFGFINNRIELSVRDPKNLSKYVGNDAMWVQAEASLAEALKARGLPYERMEGEAIFYGPKIDIKIKDALGRFWQCTTIQFDFNESEKFDMTFVGEDGQAHRPYLVHRALLGSLERFFGILIEHYAGNFPLWLAPVQAAICPIAERHHDYAQDLDRLLKTRGLRSFVDGSREKIGHKIRDAELQKIPLILVVGDKEVSLGTASLRIHGKGDRGAIKISELLEKALELNDNKSLEINI